MVLTASTISLYGLQTISLLENCNEILSYVLAISLFVCLYALTIFWMSSCSLFCISAISTIISLISLLEIRFVVFFRKSLIASSDIRFSKKSSITK